MGKYPGVKINKKNFKHKKNKWAVKGTHPVSDGAKATGEGGPLPEGQPPFCVARSSAFFKRRQNVDS